MAGRPTDYRPEFCEIVVREMKKGAAIQELPFYLDVCLDTINEWRKVHPEFSLAVKKGKSFSQAWWMKDGRESLRDEKYSYTGWYMNMKNRFGWSDKQEITQESTTKLVLEETKDIQEIRKSFEKPV